MPTTLLGKQNSARCEDRMIRGSPDRIKTASASDRVRWPLRVGKIEANVLSLFKFLTFLYIAFAEEPSGAKFVQKVKNLNSDSTLASILPTRNGHLTRSLAEAVLIRSGDP